LARQSTTASGVDLRRLLFITIVLIIGPAIRPALSVGAKEAERFASVEVFGAKCDSNGVSKNGTDDSAAFLAADAPAMGFAVHARCRIATDMRLASPILFGPGGRLVIDPGITVTLASSRRPVAAKTQQIFDGGGSAVLASAPYASVAWWGAVADQAAGRDPAPAVRAAFVQANNRTVDFVGRSLTFRSALPVPYPAIDPTAIPIQNLSGVTIDLRGARLSMDDAHTYTGILLLDRLSHPTVLGGNFVGNRAGMTASQENAALVLLNIVGGVFRDQTFSGDWDFLGAPFVGDWLINTTIERANILSAGICFDFGFMQNVKITFRAKGSGKAPQVCFSSVYDTLLAAYNHTGIAFTETNHVQVASFGESGFNTGWRISSGRGYIIDGDWSSNPGAPPQAKGIGGYIFYANEGNFPSVGHPPGDIRIRGQYRNNGATVRGYGILIDPAAIQNSDRIDAITIQAIFSCNNGTDVDATTVNHLSNVRLRKISPANRVGTTLWSLPSLSIEPF
jgi:hypothetical protein